MSLAAIIQNHLAYDWWASSRLLDAASSLTDEQLNRDFGTADKSIKGTLIHILRSARTWLGRVDEGTSSTPWSLPDDEDWPGLQAKWADVHNRWTRWAEAQTDDDLHRVLEYTDLKGKPWSQPLWQLVLHVVNHGTHHRGQVSGFLRCLGVPPPPLDFIAYMRLRQSK
jgi:uncharacterized damage-inducible protein DinB